MFRRFEVSVALFHSIIHINENKAILHKKIAEKCQKCYNNSCIEDIFLVNKIVDRKKGK